MLSKLLPPQTSLLSGIFVDLIFYVEVRIPKFKILLHWYYHYGLRFLASLSEACLCNIGNATIKTSVRVGRTSDSTERGASLSPPVLIHIAPSASAFFSNNFPHSLFSVPPSHLLVARTEGHRARAQGSSGTQPRRLRCLPPSSLMPPHALPQPRRLC